MIGTQSHNGSRSRPGVLVSAYLTVLAVLAASLLGSPSAAATTVTVTTYEGHEYGDGALVAPSADKPQSKLWWNDGSWWALMAGRSTVNIYRLDPDHVWRDTGVVVDDRIDSTADALWSAGELVVASRTIGGDGIRVRRFSYAVDGGRYAPVGDALTVPGGGVESVSVDRDTADRLWITFTRDSRVWVAALSAAPLAILKAPFRVPGADTEVFRDDISAVISLQGKIGVMWSDQQSSVIRFAVREDSAPLDGPWTVETPLDGTRIADDHINLKSLLGDDQGRVHAAVKTSLGDGSEPDSAPSIMVLSRSSDGSWVRAVGATVGDNQTRPQLALDRTNRRLYLLQSEEGGGTVHYKSASLDDITFPGGRGTPFVQWQGGDLNNVSTAKDPVDAGTGLVAIATDTSAGRYYHAEMTLPGTPPTSTPTPVAPEPGGSVLAAGQQLSAGQSLSSPGGTYRLVVQGDGNVVVYAGSRVLWHARTSGNPGARLVMQGDGNLVAYSAANRPLWSTGTRGSARLVLQEDGNLVVYRTTDNRPLWNTGADKPATTAPAAARNVLTAGQQMSAGQQLTAGNGRYRLLVQADGNDVVYTGPRALWSTRTNGRTGARLVLQGDGNLVVYGTNGAALWQARTVGSGAGRLVMQDDGNLVLYRPDGRPVWNTGTDRG